MTPEQLAKWEKSWRMGRTCYVLFVGVLFWGLLTGSVWAVAMSATQGWERLPHYLAFGLIGFPIGGMFFRHHQVIGDGIEMQEGAGREKRLSPTAVVATTVLARVSGEGV
jgi:hypothetical protein